MEAQHQYGLLRPKVAASEARCVRYSFNVSGKNDAKKAANMHRLPMMANGIHAPNLACKIQMKTLNGMERSNKQDNVDGWNYHVNQLWQCNAN